MVLPRIHRSGTNSLTLSWTDATEHRGKPDAVYRGEETIEANFFCKEVFPYWFLLYMKFPCSNLVYSTLATVKLFSLLAQWLATSLLAKTNFSLGRYTNIYHFIKSSKWYIACVACGMLWKKNWPSFWVLDSHRTADETSELAPLKNFYRFMIFPKGIIRSDIIITLYIADIGIDVIIIIIYCSHHLSSHWLKAYS